MKHENGHPYNYSAERLRRFASGTGDIHLDAVTVQHVVEFIERLGASAITRQFKYSLLRNFFLHCKGRYAMGQVPLPQRPPAPPLNTFVPHLYSRDEIRTLLQA